MLMALENGICDVKARLCDCGHGGCCEEIAQSQLHDGSNANSMHLTIKEHRMSRWDRSIDNARFQVLQEFNNEAVLDRETGLVWERQPSNQAVAWPNARLSCAQKSVGGRGGWRLPAFYELASLIDPAVNAGVALPPGNPFLQVQATDYWSDTQFVGGPNVLIVNFAAVAGTIKVTDASLAAARHAWAVRGGSPGLNGY